MNAPVHSVAGAAVTLHDRALRAHDRTREARWGWSGMRWATRHLDAFAEAVRRLTDPELRDLWRELGRRV